MKNLLSIMITLSLCLTGCTLLPQGTPEQTASQEPSQIVSSADGITSCETESYPETEGTSPVPAESTAREASLEEIPSCEDTLEKEPPTLSPTKASPEAPETTPPETDPVKPPEPKPTAPPVTLPPETEQPETEPLETEPPEPIPVETAPPESAAAPKKAVVTEEAISRIRAGFLNLVNQERGRAGVGSLRENAHLEGAAHVRSVEIKNCWSHTRPDGTPFYTVVDGNSYPYIGIGENIGITAHLGMKEFTQEDLFIGTDEQIAMASQSIYELFRYSPPHYANMICGDYTDCGIGIDYMINEESGMPLFTISHIFGHC